MGSHVVITIGMHGVVKSSMLPWHEDVNVVSVCSRVVWHEVMNVVSVCSRKCCLA